MTLTLIRITPVQARKFANPRPRWLYTPIATWGLTLARVPIAGLIVASIVSDLKWTTAVLVLVFVTIDVLDGIVARHFGAETPLRRFMDGALDRVAVHLATIALCVAQPDVIWVWAAMLIHDGAQLAVGLRTYKRHNILATGAGWHRLYSVAVAVWGISAFVSSQPQIELALVVVLVGTLTILDYTAQCARLGRIRPLP